MGADDELRPITEDTIDTEAERKTPEDLLNEIRKAFIPNIQSTKARFEDPDKPGVYWDISLTNSDDLFPNITPHASVGMYGAKSWDGISLSSHSGSIFGIDVDINPTSGIPISISVGGHGGFSDSETQNQKRAAQLVADGLDAYTRSKAANPKK